MKFPERTLLAVVGAVFVALITSTYGIGLTWDSADYISAARSLVDGDGLWLYRDMPLVWQPPLYSLLLAALDLVTDSTFVSARILNVFLFGAIVWMAGMLIYRYTAGRWWATAGMVATLISPAMLLVYAMAWTETLFIALLLLFFLIVERWQRGYQHNTLVWMAVLAAAICMTRYIGVCIVATGLAVISLARLPWRARLRDGAVFGAVSAAPLLVWMARNHTLTGTLLGPREASQHSLSMVAVQTARSMLTWFVPDRLVSQNIVLLAAGVGAVLLMCLVVVVLWRSRALDGGKLAPIAIYLASYLALLVWSSTTTVYDAIGDRLLAPVYVPALIGTLCLAHSWLATSKSRYATIAAVAVVSLWLLYPMRLFAAGVSTKLREGAGGYSTKAWREDVLMAQVARLAISDATIVYSNVPDAIYLLTGITAMPLYDGDAVAPGAYYVWHEAAAHREFLHSPDELQDVFDLSTEYVTAEGAVYTLKER